MAGRTATSTSTSTTTTSKTTISRITLKQVRQVSGGITRNIAGTLPTVIEEPRISLVDARQAALVGQVVLAAREELASLAAQVGSGSRAVLAVQVALENLVAPVELVSLAAQVGPEGRAVPVARVELESPAVPVARVELESPAVLAAQGELASPVVQAELGNPVARVAPARQVVRVELGNPADLAARQSKQIVQVAGIRLAIRTWEIKAALRRAAAAAP